MRDNSKWRSNKTKADNVKPVKGGKSKSYNKSRNKGRDKMDDAKLDSSGRDNDPNWYFFSPELAKQCAQLSFQSVLGLGSIQGYSIPTTAIVWCNPSPGMSTFVDTANARTLEYGTAQWPNGHVDDSNPVNKVPNAATGINIASQKTYTLLAAYSGRTSNYQPQDVGMMELAIASFAEVSEHARRIYGLALTYNSRNRIFPKLIIEQMGIDFDDLKANMADYRMRFNTLISRINTIPLLDNIGYIRKSRDMYQHVYGDHDSSMAQIFAFAPSSAWVLDEASYSAGTILDSINIKPYVNAGIASTNTFAQLLSTMETQVSALLESTTLNLVYSDLRHLASKMSFATWQFDYLAENYVVLPMYNRTASMQFHHATPMGEPLTYGATGTTPNYVFHHIDNDGVDGDDFTYGNCVLPTTGGNTIFYNPLFESGHIGQDLPGETRMIVVPNIGIIDMDTDTPTDEDKIEALRFSSIYSGYWIGLSPTDRSNYTFPSNYFHTNVYDIVFTYPTISDHYVTEIYFFKGGLEVEIGLNPSMISEARISASSHSVSSATISQFEKGPMRLYAQRLDNTHPDYTYQYIYTDLEFFTTVDYAYLRRVNDLMMVGLLDFRV